MQKQTMHSAERAQREIVRLCHAGLDAPSLRAEISKRLRTAIPLDVAFVATADPATLLFTGVTVDDVLERATPQFLDNEFLRDDVNHFAWLARNRLPVGGLCAATGEHLARSPRFRDILAPMGLGDELRVALVSGSTCWGFMCLHRERSAPAFSPAEAALLARLAPHLAEGLRKALLIGGASDSEPATAEEPGVLLLADDLSPLSSTPTAAAWLADLAGSDHWRGNNLLAPIAALVARLRAVERGTAAPTEVVPKVRIRAPSGRWLVAHASRLSQQGASDSAHAEGPIAVILEPARPAELAPLLVRAYGLSPREGEIAMLVTRGWSTAEMAAQLWITADTVQDHLKAIFDKVGVHSRRELAARFFFQHYQPQIAAQHKPTARGQFAAPDAASAH